MNSIWSLTKRLVDVNSTQSTAISILILLGIGFMTYNYISEYLKSHFERKFTDTEISSFYGYITQRLIGFFTFGLFPAIVFMSLNCKPLWYYGINAHNFKTSLIWIIILGTAIILVNFFFAKQESNLDQYPQIRLTSWNVRSYTLNMVTWILYLFGYELMFRGLLLFTLYHAFGLSFSIVTTTLLYALVHLPKGRKETLGSIPLGIILGLISIQTGSFLTAFIFHVIMAISNDSFAIRYNPSMKIKFRKI